MKREQVSSKIGESRSFNILKVINQLDVSVDFNLMRNLKPRIWSDVGRLVIKHMEQIKGN